MRIGAGNQPRERGDTLKIELDEKEMEQALCEWVSRLEHDGGENLKFNRATFYKLDRGFSVTLEWVEACA